MTCWREGASCPAWRSGSVGGGGGRGPILLRPAKIIERVACLPVQRRKKIGGRRLRNGGDDWPSTTAVKPTPPAMIAIIITMFRGSISGAFWLVQKATIITNRLKPRQIDPRNWFVFVQVLVTPRAASGARYHQRKARVGGKASASGRPSSRRTIFVPCTSATILKKAWRRLMPSRPMPQSDEMTSRSGRDDFERAADEAATSSGDSTCRRVVIDDADGDFLAP